MAEPGLFKVAILVNNLSGKGSAIKIGNWLVLQLTEIRIEYELFAFNWPENYDGFSDIWLVGGDGTLNYFLNKNRNITLPLFLFKGGTGNDFAWKLYGDSTPEQQLKIALSAPPRKVDAALCNDQIYVNSSGIGFDGEVLKSIGMIRWLGGHLGYLTVVIRKIFSFKEHTFTIRTREKILQDRFLLVIVNNSSRTGGGFMVTPRASVTDGKLDLLLCKPLSLLKRLRYLPVIEKGKHLDLPFILYSQEESIRIEANEEIFAQLDGELIRSKVFDIRILPGKLWIRY
ncbi:MAG: diacylglycerol kinase family protein [Ferruginibacter sp.]